MRHAHRAEPRLGMVAGGVAAALVLTACGAATIATAPWRAGTGAMASARAARWGAIDVGLVRLHVPTSWQLTWGDAASCVPGADGAVYLSRVPPSGECRGGHDHESVWVVAGAARATPGHRSVRVGRSAVEIADPALGVTLYGFGAMGVRAAESLRPSPLGPLLATKDWPTAPRSWHRVRAGVVSVEVPATWPTVSLARPILGGSWGAREIDLTHPWPQTWVGAHRRMWVQPGLCGGPIFTQPGLVVGESPLRFMVFCPMLLGNAVAMADVRPGNGVWVHGVGPGWGPSRFLYPPGTYAHVHRRIGGLSVTLVVPTGVQGSSVVDALVSTGHGEDVLVVLGLGGSATTAATVLGSLRLAAR